MAGRRVLFVFCSLELGGAERQGMHLARYLKGQGCQVTVWATHAGRGIVADRCDELGIPWAVHRFRWPCRRSSLVRDSWRMVRALRRERPDVILPYTTWPNVGCGLTWRWSPASVCVWGQRSIDDLRGDWVERLAFRRVSAIICNAAHEVEYLRRTLGATPVPISVVHNGIELAPPKKNRGQWREGLGINADATVVTMVANFRQQKDHTTLLHAWKQLVATLPDKRPSPRLLLAGVPQESYESVQRLVTNLGLRDTVTFLDQVRDVSGLLSATDIGVLTSIHEGLPNAVIEYMASGLPVIATDLPGNREALGDKPDQPYVSRGDSDRLAEMLAALIGCPAKRERLAERNRERAQELFSVATMCRTTADVLAGLLEGESP